MNSQKPAQSPERASVSAGAWRLFLFMVFVFLVFLISYAGLELGYRKYLEAQISNSQAELTQLTDEVSKDKQDAFLKFQLQLQSLQGILASHTQLSEFFKILEANTNQKVLYNGMSVSLPEKRISLQGIAASYEVLAGQLLAYDHIPQITHYQISNTRVTDGGRIDFSLVLSLDPRVLQFSPSVSP